MLSITLKIIISINKVSSAYLQNYKISTSNSDSFFF